MPYLGIKIEAVRIIAGIAAVAFVALLISPPRVFFPIFGLLGLFGGWLLVASAPVLGGIVLVLGAIMLVHGVVLNFRGPHARK